MAAMCTLADSGTRAITKAMEARVATLVAQQRMLLTRAAEIRAAAARAAVAAAKAAAREQGKLLQDDNDASGMTIDIQWGSLLSTRCCTRRVYHVRVCATCRRRCRV